MEAVETLSSSGVDTELTRARERRMVPYGGGSTYPDEENVRTQDVTRDLRELREGEPQDVAGFTVTPVPVDHSVPGACAFHVETPSGRTIFYTGDVRFHGRLRSRTDELHAFAEELDGVDLMLSEGTRIAASGGDSEADIETDLTDIVGSSEGFVAAEFAWKDTTRFDTLVEVARATERTLLVSPKVAYVLDALDGRPDVPSTRVEAYKGDVEVFLGRKGSMQDQRSDYGKHEVGYETDWSAKEMRDAREAGDRAFLDRALRHYDAAVRPEDVRRDPRRFLVHLTFWDSSDLLDLDPTPGRGTWVRCQTEPFSDEMELDLARQRNWLEFFGLRHNLPALDGHPAGPLHGTTTHVSGHASGEGLKDLIHRVGPQELFPIHVEARHLDRFQDQGAVVRTFPEATAEAIARGRVSVEI